MAARTRRATPPRVPPMQAATVTTGPEVIVAVLLQPVPLVQAAWRTVPSRRGTALAIAEPGGVVNAVCPLAAACGVTVGQSWAQARLHCPALLHVVPERDATAVLWEEALSALGSVSPLVEAADAARGLAYLEARGLQRLWGDGAAVGRQALRVLAAAGITALAGAGPTRLVALALAQEMGRDSTGPHLLAGPEARAFLRALPLDHPTLALPDAVVGQLADLDVRSGGALVDLPEAGVALRFDAAVCAVRRQLSLAAEPPLRPWVAPLRRAVTRRYEDGIVDTMQLDRLVTDLCAALAVRLVHAGEAAATLTLTLGCDDGAQQIYRVRLWPPLQEENRLVGTARDLLARSTLTTPVLEVMLVASDLTPPPVEQPGLWDVSRIDRRVERLAATLQAHVRQHGPDGLRRLQRDPLSREGWSFEHVDPSS